MDISDLAVSCIIGCAVFVVSMMVLTAMGVINHGQYMLILLISADIIQLAILIAIFNNISNSGNETNLIVDERAVP